MRRESFERFYYEKIALAEGCGCAEHVTRMRDIEEFAAARSAPARRQMAFGWTAPALLKDRALRYLSRLRESRIWLASAKRSKPNFS
ncbi:MAG TPA: hypothetical protein VMF90_25180 [Rhizobiaceae bacterium]|nr:hypothetical protein [Rhizobiaceae bacterium]